MRFLHRTTGQPRQRFQRGVYILPTLFTLGNMFCGYACIVYAMRGEFETAAPFIGYSIVLDMLDGRIARMTGSASDFGVEFDSLADVISFGIAPAILSLSWGLQPLGRLGWLAGFLFLTAAAMRLAYPYALTDYRAALPVLAMVLVPAALMVSTIRFRSFKSIDLQSRRSYTVVILLAAGIALIATHPRVVLVVLAYSYLASAFVGLAISRLRKAGRPSQDASPHAVPIDPPARDGTVL